MTITVGTEQEARDLVAASFVALAEEFFQPDGQPRPFHLRDKKNTQDDPFDELVIEVLNRRLPADIRVISSGKKLVSPDLVVARPEESRLLEAGGRDFDTTKIAAIEVKKVNPTQDGEAARGKGIDYNSTPPCATVRIEAANGNSLRVPAFYLFVLLVPQENEQNMKSMALVAGAAINQDTDLYDSITGIRQKKIGLGTFGDGYDRQRPMLVFANPLGWSWTMGEATLIHTRDDLAQEQAIVRVREVRLSATDGSMHVFWCYRRDDGRQSVEPTAINPFPTPDRRTAETNPRGKFKVRW